MVIITENLDIKKVIKIVVIAIAIIILILLLRSCGNSSENAKIELIGDNPLVVNQNEVYVDPGYNITGTNNANNYYANIDGYVDVNKSGTYLLTYSLYNNNGSLVSEEERQVIVLENNLANVSLFLKGEEEEFFFANDYVDHGVEAYDDNNDISDLIEISSNVDEKSLGSYEVTYQIVAGNNYKEIVRKVNIINYDIERNLDEKNLIINLVVNCDDYYYTVLPDGTEFYSRYISYSYDEVGQYVFDIYLKSGSHKKYTVEITSIKTEEEEETTVNKPKIPDIALSGSCTLEYKNDKTKLTMKVTPAGHVSRYIVNGTQFTGNTYQLSGYVGKITVIAFNRANKPYPIRCENKVSLYPSGLQPINYGKLGWFPCNNDVSSANQELAAKVKSYGLRSRGAVAAAATYLANYKYGIQYFWAGKYEQIGLNPRWGCRAGVVEMQKCSVELDETHCEWGLDCTGFTKWAYIQAGFEPGLIPRSAQEQSAWGSFIASKHLYAFNDGNIAAANNIKPGDLVSTPLIHVGVVIGVDGSRVQVAHESGGIKVTLLSKATGKSTNDSGDFTHFVLMDEFYKTYGTG